MNSYLSVLYNPSARLIGATKLVLFIDELNCVVPINFFTLMPLTGSDLPNNLLKKSAT